MHAMSKVAVTAWIKAKPGHKARLNEISATLQRKTLAHEPGCLSYLLCQAHPGLAELAADLEANAAVAASDKGDRMLRRHGA